VEYYTYLYTVQPIKPIKNMSYIQELRKAFPQFTWTFSGVGINKSYFGTINVNPISRRNKETKAREVTGPVYIYISSEMYPGTSKNFVYATCSQRIKTIDFGRKTEYLREHGKVFESGKTREILLKKLKKAIKMKMYDLDPIVNFTAPTIANLLTGIGQGG